MNRHLTTLIAAALVLAGCGGGDASPQATAPTAAVTTCDEVAYTPRNPARWVHPSQSFYAPDTPAAPSGQDLDHLLLNDNAVVVSYPADAPRATRDRLAKWASEQVAAVVVPDRSPSAPPLQARIATAQLTCNGVDSTQLTAFAAKRAPGSVVPHGDEG